MNVAVLVLVAIVGVGVAAALEALKRGVNRTATEPHLRPLAAGGRGPRGPRPPELVQLEAIVADVAAGDRVAMARLTARLRAIGVDPGLDPSPADLLRALATLRDLDLDREPLS